MSVCVSHRDLRVGVCRVFERCLLCFLSKRSVCLPVCVVGHRYIYMSVFVVNGREILTLFSVRDVSVCV